MATDNERREVAARLRGRQGAVGQDEDSPELTKWEDLAAIVLTPEEFYACMRFKNRDNRAQAIRSIIAGRLADLIDPTCEVHRDALFYPATDLTPEHEEAVFRCGKCEEIVSYDADYDPETDLPAYCERCGSRITGIGEPWDE